MPKTYPADLTPVAKFLLDSNEILAGHARFFERRRSWASAEKANAPLFFIGLGVALVGIIVTLASRNKPGGFESGLTMVGLGAALMVTSAFTAGFSAAANKLARALEHLPYIPHGETPASLFKGILDQLCETSQLLSSLNDANNTKVLQTLLNATSDARATSETSPELLKALRMIKTLEEKLNEMGFLPEGIFVAREEQESPAKMFLREAPSASA